MPRLYVQGGSGAVTRKRKNYRFGPATLHDLELLKREHMACTETEIIEMAISVFAREVRARELEEIKQRLFP